jgi:hypothetical protein
MRRDEHTIKYWAMEPGVVLLRIIVDLEGIRKGYLGPRESWRFSLVLVLVEMGRRKIITLISSKT